MKTEQYISTFPAPLFKVFRNWLQTGWIQQDAAMGSAGASPPIYGTLGQFVATHSNLLHGEEETRVQKFLDQQVLAGDGRQITVRESLRDGLKPMLGWLIEMAVDRVEDANWEKKEQLKALGRQNLLEQGGDQLVDNLLGILEEEVGHLRVVELFKRRRHEVGFASWSAYSAEMLLEARQVQETPTGRLYLGMDFATESDSPVDAIEWVGGVRMNEEWQVLMSGVVYVFNPSCINGNRSLQLMRAADEMSSGDHERTLAFVSAHGNAEAILEKGDIAFLWEWERRHGSSPGIGLESLAAVCEHLRRQHERLSSIVIAISPERFVPKAANEPLVVERARLSDIDKLRAYVLTTEGCLGLKVYVTVSKQNDISRQPETARPYC